MTRGGYGVDYFAAEGGYCLGEEVAGRWGS